MMKCSRLSKTERRKIRNLISHLQMDIREAKTGIARDIESIEQLESI